MIRALRRQEFSTVEAWRKIHFANMNTGREVIGQRGFDEAMWLCVERREQVIAACSYTDDAEHKRRRIEDIYAAPGHALAAIALAEFMERMADYQGYEIRGATDPENVRYIELVLRRGYELTAVEFRRVPRVRENRVHDREGLPSLDEGSFPVEEQHVAEV